MRFFRYNNYPLSFLFTPFSLWLRSQPAIWINSSYKDPFPLTSFYLPQSEIWMECIIITWLSVYPSASPAWILQKMILKRKGDWFTRQTEGSSNFTQKWFLHRVNTLERITDRTRVPNTPDYIFLKRKLFISEYKLHILYRIQKLAQHRRLKKPFCCNSVICLVAIKWECWDFNFTIWFPASTIINFLLFCCYRIKWKLMMWNPVLSRLWWASSTRWGSASIWQCGRWLQCSPALPGSCAFWQCSAWIRPPRDCCFLQKCSQSCIYVHICFFVNSQHTSKL